MERPLQIIFKILMLLGVGLTAHAQPTLVTTAPGTSTNFTLIGDLVFFTSEGELWRTDGTAEGTVLLRGGFQVFNQSPQFTGMNGFLYFPASRNSDFTSTYKELWRSDGTPEGTVLLKTSTDYNIRIVGVAGNVLYFQASDPGTGLELFRTNGTPGGTSMLKDINPGTGNGFVYPYSAGVLGIELLFAADNGTSGIELWKTNGRADGTVMVSDINPGAGDGFAPNTVFVFNGVYYFKGNTADHGMEPWISDGTAVGTSLLKDITPGPEGNRYFQYTIAFNGVYFISSPPQEESRDEGSVTELWKTGGTAVSTVKIRNLGDGTVQVHPYFRIYNNKVYFFLESENGTDNLWVTDGSAAGTTRIYDLQNFEGGLAFFEVAGGYLLFYGDSDGFPTPFYRSDGTSAGTQEFRRFNAGYYLVFPRDVTKVDDLVFFADHDGPSVMGHPDVSEDYYQLMQTDGATTRSLRDVFGESFEGSDNITDFNGQVLFTTEGEGSDTEKTIWIYDPLNPPADKGTFTLVNADTDEDIKTLVDGDVIGKSETENINVRFNPAEPPGSVRFILNGSNVRTENAAPYSLAGDASGNYNPWTGASSGSYTLTATPYSGSGAGGTAGEPTTIHFTIEADTGGEECMASGTILREYWDNVSGNHVSAIPVTSTPTSTSNLNIFEGPTNVDTNYGARIRGYICPPATGDYTFWIASNDHSELWLSSDVDPSKKKKIAYITGATNPRQWDKFGTQKSAPVNLTAGKRYYIEALHKQGVGTDNLAVGWQLPDGTLERPIPGSRLSPGEPEENINPVVTIESPVTGQTFYSPATINIHANASDEDGIMFVQFYAMNTNGGHLFTIGEQDNTAPYSVTWSNVQAGDYLIRAEAQDNEGGFSKHEIMIEVVDQCNASGSISWEYWGGVQGNRVSDIPLDSPPTRTGNLSNFEGPVNLGTNYGSRIRGYVCAPATGDYYFSISSNDHSELWLSNDDNPANKLKIASVTGATNFQQYDKFSSQNSVAVPLIQGKSYYIEALHKQGVGSDHVSVAWTRPDVGFDGSIDGQYLSPFAFDNSGSTARVGNTTDPVADAQFQQINIYPNPAQSGNRELNIAGYEDIEESVETDVEIINMAGEVVYAGKVLCGGNCGAYVMNINQQLVPGLYLVNLKTNGIKMSKRLLVK